MLTTLRNKSCAQKADILHVKIDCAVGV